MITLPAELEAFMQQQDLKGLKLFALLYRNKWVIDESGSSESGHFELEDNPIDITDMIVKPNTLSMTLDVNEVAQYNCNNVTLTLSDTKNKLVEGIPNSLFPEGYQLYGSKVVLYYGIEKQDYIIENGKLLWANPNLYLQNTANSYIDTGVLADSNTQAILEYRIDDFKEIASSTRNYIISGSTSYQQMANFYASFWAQGSPANARYWLNTSNRGSATAAGTAFADTTAKYKLTLNGTNIDTNSYVLKDDGTTYTYTNNAGTITQDRDIRIFNRTNNPVSASSFLGKIYNCIINQNGITVRHFVPVPAGLKIGDFFVPSNGMFDIITQTFYGNIGTGGFSYGYDKPSENPNRIPIFTGRIKELPTYKPDTYQVDLKLVSPLEMLKDIEAKEFSDKYIGEILTYIEDDEDGYKIYQTTGAGVGGFYAVYANGTKLFDGIDYEVSQINTLALPAVVKIINSDYYSDTITADYYTWKNDLTVEQIVEGLVALAGYDSSTEDIRNVVWNTEIRSAIYPDIVMSRGYKQNGINYDFVGDIDFFNDTFANNGKYFSYSILPKNFLISFSTNHSGNYNAYGWYTLGTRDPNYQYAQGGLLTGIAICFSRRSNYNDITAMQFINGTAGTETVISQVHSANDVSVSIRVEDNVAYISGNYGSVTYTFDAGFDWGASGTYNQSLYHPGTTTLYFKDFNLTELDDNLNAGGTLTSRGVVVQSKNLSAKTFSLIDATFADNNTQYSLSYRYDDNGTFTQWQPTQLGSDIGVSSTVLQAELNITEGFPSILSLSFYYLSTFLVLRLVNLTGKTVLGALQDLALISGYEFGVDRNGIFFFRPRISSTTPIYELGHNELTKVDTVKKNLNDFFTKLTLTFAQIPLEFYANTGDKPTPVDRYGILNKEIDKPEIVNYDNPELAQAIGPQLLEIYSSLPNIIQATGKLNLSLELGDIVNLKRNETLVEPNSATDYRKFINQQTYYRACKITGMNYNFSKKQITYTLRDVSNSNNSPVSNAEMWEFVYDFPIQLGAK